MSLYAYKCLLIVPHHISSAGVACLGMFSFSTWVSSGTLTLGDLNCSQACLTPKDHIELTSGTAPLGSWGWITWAAWMSS